MEQVAKGVRALSMDCINYRLPAFPFACDRARTVQEKFTWTNLRGWQVEWHWPVASIRCPPLHHFSLTGCYSLRSYRIFSMRSLAAFLPLEP